VRVAERDVERRALGIAVLRLAELVEPLFEAIEEQQRAASLLVRLRLVLETEPLIGDLECLGPVVRGEQRLAVHVIADRIGEVRVVVLLRDLLRLLHVAVMDQDVDALLDDVDVLAQRIRLGVAPVRRVEVVVLRVLARFVA
jgi:hypothetical protein